jgi:hypothetical protein
MIYGIVGSGADKFTRAGARRATQLISRLVAEADVVASGHSPMGGVDIWAELEAATQDKPFRCYAPKVHQWNPPGGYGYKARNLDIARSDVVHCIVPDALPPEYAGMRFDLCYHCAHTPNSGLDHVKSGGCWTMHQCQIGVLHIVDNSE